MSNKEFNREATDLIHKSMTESLERIENKVDSVEKHVIYTNGKVKRIILALVAVSSFSIGLGLIEARTLLSLIT
jgi:exosortase/archaeosortase